MMAQKERVCVTGAGGFQASWLVKLLLSHGYLVHGTVRDPNDEKNAHLKTLEKTSENLQLFKADLLDLNALCAAIAGCTGVFHIACPVPGSSVPNPEVELIEPTVIGTMNVLKACSLTKVKRVVLQSSIAAVTMNPNWPKDQAMDESCWSDKEYCKTSKLWYNLYSLAKTEAESLALEYAKGSEFDVVTVCPSTIIGPMLQSSTNTSSLLLLKFFSGESEELGNIIWQVVDVRDVAEALLLLYKKSESEGRYICTSSTITIQDLMKKLKSLYPKYNYPKLIAVEDEVRQICSDKLQKLGWKYRPLEETLVDIVENYYGKGLLVKL